MTVTASTAVRTKRKHTLLPLLIVLFVISYVLLTTFVIEQATTIDSQSTLIHLLFRDSLHLSALKAELRGRQVRQVDGATGSLQVPSAKIPVIQVPSGKTPSAHVPSAQVQSGKTSEHSSTKTDRKSHKAQKQSPANPPAELTDPSDMRRVSFSI